MVWMRMCFMHDEVNIKRLLASSDEAALGDFLIAQLPTTQFSVSPVRPGAAFVEAVRRERPHIAVLDLSAGRTDAVLMEIATLKQMCPESRIIVISEQSSTEDAMVIEAGVFFYLVTQREQDRDLLRIIDAAAQERVSEA